MKRIIFAVIAFLLLSSLAIGMPGTAKWKSAWDANTESDLAGYKIYWSLTSGNYTDTDSKDMGNVTEQLFSGLPLVEGNLYYFVITAYDTSGNESGFSNEISYFFDQTAPGVPVNLHKELVIEF